MPKDTFYNLPEDKKEKITEAAITEFEQYSFEQSSINRIISQAGIAKGSFYQYFEDKKDLYIYVLSLMADEKIKYISPHLANPANLDFYTLIKEMYKSALEFARNNPRMMKIGSKLLADKGSPAYEELMEQNMTKSYAFFEEMVKLGQARGELRQDLDTHLTGYLISSINTSLVYYYMDYNKNELDEGIFEKLDQLLDMLRNGLSS